MENIPPKYVSIKQASEIYGLHPNTIRAYIRNKKIRAIRLESRIIRIELSELENLFTEYREGEFGIWSKNS